MMEQPPNHSIDTPTPRGVPRMGGRQRDRWSLVLLVPIAWALVAAYPPPARGRAVVAADHPLASQAGAEILARGGNAVDAAVAAVLASGVVQPSGSGFGGGGFAVVVRPNGTPSPDTWILDFRETAPARASRDMYLDAGGKVREGASRSGGLAVAVPGQSRGLAKLVAEHGRLSLAADAAPAIRLASEGFPVGGFLAKQLASGAEHGVDAFFSIGGHLAREGDPFRNAAQAKTLRLWASSRGEHLASGDGAKAIVAAANAKGGLLTVDDLATYAPVERDAIRTRYRGELVVGMPPPSSGGVVVGEVLDVLDGYDVGALGPGSADWFHLCAEALQHGFADRAHFLGDPGFVDVPTGELLSQGHIDAIRHAIWPARTFPADHYGAPTAGPPEDHGTLHVSVIDADGMAVSLTTTINGVFGAGIVVPELGIVLNDEMDDFVTAPDQPNQYGLVGQQANEVAPGKRPLSSMAPTVIVDPDGKVRAALGGSGGPRIISNTVQVIVGLLDFHLDAQAAVSMPRIHHQWQPRQLFLEPETPPEVVRALEAIGHEVKVQPNISAVQAVFVEPDGTVEGGSDPRKGGVPAVVY